ncbi:MAG: flavodoxin family protein [Clostridia bacterium]|nr:flavodoxin family protein [Clostridia bacterium]
MKTLIINGSPKSGGDTAALIDAFVSALDGEYRIVSHSDGISPCLDCRYCWKHEGCALRDGMQPLYDYLADCDCVVLASPVWFSSLASPALAIGSRLQTFFAAKFFRHAPAPLTPKRGVILITGAQPGTEEGPVCNARTILGLAGVRREDITVVRSMNTDRVPASEDSDALTAAADAARMLSVLPR